MACFLSGSNIWPQINFTKDESDWVEAMVLCADLLSFGDFSIKEYTGAKIAERLLVECFFSVSSLQVKRVGHPSGKIPDKPE
jgi:hypothetical protein